MSRRPTHHHDTGTTHRRALKIGASSDSLKKKPLALAVRCVLASCLVLPALPAAAQPRFAGQSVDSNAAGPSAVFSADMDRDGDMDLLSASRDDNKIAWYENNGARDPYFSLRTITTSALGASSVFAADLDGDGDIDVISGSRDDDKIAWYENDGDQSFVVHTVSTNADDARSIFAVDLDGDGDTDLMSASRGDGKIAWYENGGGADPSFTARTITSVAGDPSTVFGADMDGDGDIDVVSTSVAADNVTWYENDGTVDPVFTLRTVATSVDGPISLYAADLDGDGDTDLVTAGYYDNTLRWHENVNQAFQLRTIDGNASGAIAVTASDLDGDGDIDVMASLYSENKVVWYENDGALEPSFTAREIATEAMQPNSVFAADLDGDGDTDIVSTSQADSQISWHENSDRQAFAQLTDKSPITTSATGVLALAASDVDGDGDNDVISASPGDNKLAWYESVDGSAFAIRTITTQANEVVSVYAADLDKDGDADLVSALRGDGAIVWHESSGGTDPTFVANTISTGTPGANAVFVADLNGDGHVDVLSASDGDNKIAWYQNDGGQNPSFSIRTISTLALGASDVYVADLDADGDLDVLSASMSDNAVSWYENNGDAVPAFTQQTISVAVVGASSVYAADLDGDGDIDVLSTSYGEGKVVWHENDGNVDPQFSAHTITADAEGATFSSAADIDADGDLDILAGAALADTTTWYENDGQQHYTQRTLAGTAGGSNSILAADLDADGDVDIAVAFADRGRIEWHENRTIHSSASIQIEHILSTSALSAFAVFAIDLDVDGDMDMLSASFLDDKLAWYENDGGQRFELHTISTNANSTRSVFAIDMDRDGDIDVLAASRDDGKVAWYENDGDETFSERTITDTALEPVFTRAGDVDGDGDIDVVSASRRDSKIAWYENDGSQNFSLHTITTDMLYASASHTVDLDGDGDTDVLAASFGDDKIFWFENDGDQNFGQRTVSVAADGPRGIHYADIDSDGDLDVVSASVYQNLIAWHENDGEEGFTLRSISTNAIAAVAVFAADADGDGDIDIYSGSIEDDKVAWYENDGAENFSIHTIVTTADSPRFVMAADMDGDGDMDALSASRFDNTVAWYENCGGQFLTEVEDLTNSSALDGERIQLLSIQWMNNGRAGDSAAVLDSLTLRWFDGQGSALTTAAANRLVERVLVYHDLENNQLTPDDPLLALVSDLSLTPVGLSQAAQQISFIGPAVESSNGMATLLVVADIAKQASEQTPGSFQVNWSATLPGPQTSDAESASALSLECPTSFSSAVIAAQPVVDKLFSDNFGD